MEKLKLTAKMSWNLPVTDLPEVVREINRQRQVDEAIQQDRFYQRKRAEYYRSIKAKEKV